MTAPVFVGDEVTAAGYRLAGARVLIPDEGTVGTVFAAALEEAELVLITAACAAQLSDIQLDQIMRAADPLVLVVPDAANRIASPDLSADVDRVLGIEQ